MTELEREYLRSCNKDLLHGCASFLFVFSVVVGIFMLPRPPKKVPLVPIRDANAMMFTVPEDSTIEEVTFKGQTYRLKKPVPASKDELLTVRVENGEAIIEVAKK